MLPVAPGNWQYLVSKIVERVNNTLSLQEQVKLPLTNKDGCIVTQVPNQQ